MQKTENRKARSAVCALCLVLCICDCCFADRLERRGSEPALDGRVIRIDDSGVTMHSATGAEHTVTWDRVRDVQMDHPDPALAEYRDVAANLWRARSRLERGDTTLAEPLFDRLFAEYCAHQQRKRTHETALIVAEGLLRCRLARGANDAAMMPALEVARLRRKGITTLAYATLPPMFDESTALCTALPPAWARTSGLARIQTELNSFDAAGDVVVAAMAALYSAAMRENSGVSWDLPPKLAEDQRGVALLRLLIGAQVAQSDERAAARGALEKQMADLPAWAQAWARYAIGTSLLREEGEARQYGGLVSLSHIPATFARQQPHLAALALATMSRTLQQLGENEGATALRNELARLFPNHPAITAGDLPAVPSSQPQSAAVATSPGFDFSSPSSQECS